MITCVALFAALLILGYHWGEVEPKAIASYLTVWFAVSAIAWMLVKPDVLWWVWGVSVLLSSLLILQIFGFDPKVPGAGDDISWL